MLHEQTAIPAVMSGGTRARLDLHEIQALRAQLRGAVILPGEAGYDAARKVWNGMIDRRPALIARPADTADVQAAVAFARHHRLLTTVRGGGHNVAGSAVADDALMIDLSGMRAVEVDPAARTVRVQAGATIGELDRATMPHGLAVPTGAVSETGIAGLTLGGGYGHLRRRYGLTCDSLLAAEIVAGDGELRRASVAEHPELFWALRGGGAAPGVVTAFEFQLHSIEPEVLVALVVYPFEEARAALRGFRAYAAEAPREISALVTCAPIPALPEVPEARHGEPGVIVAACYAGPPAEGEGAVQPLRALATPLADLSGLMPYLELQAAFDADYPSHSKRYYWTSHYLMELSDEAIEQIVALTLRRPSAHTTVDIWHLGGAIHQAGPTPGAFAHRGAPYLLALEANWERATDDEANLAWARAGATALRPLATGGRYVNFPGFFEDGRDGQEALHGAARERLAKVTARYDPLGLFHVPQLAAR